MNFLKIIIYYIFVALAILGFFGSIADGTANIYQYLIIGMLFLSVYLIEK